MPSGISQGIQSAAQLILAVAVLVIGVLGIGAIASERIKRVVIDHMLGELVARASRRRLAEEARSAANRNRRERIDHAVRAIAHGLMAKASNPGDIGLETQAQIDERRHELLDALDGLITLKAEFPPLHDHLDKVIEFLNDPQKLRGASAVLLSRDYIQPILDATKEPPSVNPSV